MRAFAVVESLELRRLLSAAVDPNHPSHLLVDGTGGDDEILVEVSGTILTVTVNNTAQPFSLSAINAILINAGAGDDTVTVDADVNKQCLIDGGAGDDSLTGGATQDTLIGGDGADTLDGGAGYNSIKSDEDDTIVYTRQSGNSIFVEGTDNDDEIEIAKKVGEPGKIIITVDGHDDEFAVTSQTVVEVHAHDGHDLILVDSDVTTKMSLDGGDDSDTIQGGGGNDFIKSGHDVPSGIGDDTVASPAAGDSIDGGAGQDTLNGAEASDTIVGGVGNDCISGGAGDDQLSGGDGNDTINGSTGDDVIHGNAGDDSLFGGDGEDDLHGDDGNDTLKGGAQHDTLNGDGGRDMLFPDGVDLLRGDREDSGVDVTNGVMRIIGTTGDDAILIKSDPNGGNRVLAIVNGEDVSYTFSQGSFVQVDGGDGNDIIEIQNLYFRSTLNGGAGNDIIRGSIGPDRLNGGDGNDWLNGGDNKDTLYGEAGNDRLFGGDGKDYLNGGDGADVLRGGGGIDRILAARLIDDIRGNREDLITFAVG